MIDIPHSDRKFPLRVRAPVKFTAVLILVLSLGLHWALLQTVAWTGMIVSYSSQGSFKEALSKTFDGKHPCCLCKAIQKGRTEEKQQDQQQPQPNSKLDVGVIWETSPFNFDCDREPISASVLIPPSRSDEPPKPRPRLLLQQV